MTRDEKRKELVAHIKSHHTTRQPQHITPQSTIDIKYLQMYQNHVIPIAIIAHSHVCRYILISEKRNANDIILYISSIIDAYM